MCQVIEFPSRTGMSEHEISRVTEIIQMALEAHAAVEEHIDHMLCDPRLATLSREELLKVIENKLGFEPSR